MVQVKVSDGILEGETVTSEFGGTYHSFKGIPYAEPPVGDLRFKAPQSPRPWNGVRSAKRCGQQCTQYNFLKRICEDGSEDCLYLNVYTPDLKPRISLPVMIWLHGGAFCMGNSDDATFGPDFLIRHGVILVTLNYRLEVVGFLCLDTADIPGNAGAKDQVAAMRWVKNNISNFGGDSDNVTIFGQSCGAASVTYHCVSPMTKGLFRRAIAQSGSMMDAWAQSQKPRDRAIALANVLGCTSKDDNELYSFFMKEPIKNLIGIQLPLLWQEKVTDMKTPNLSIVSEKCFPGIEPFFSGNVMDALKSDIHEGIELIVGYNEDDGAILLALSHDIQKTIYYANNNSNYFIPPIFGYHYGMDELKDVANKFKVFYLKGNIVTKHDLSSLTKYYTAYSVAFGVWQIAKHFSVKNKTYVYKFTCHTQRNLFGNILGVSNYFKKPLVCHNDDYAYLFPIKMINQEILKTSEAYRVIYNVTKLWTNFAKNGNPTSDISLGCNWPQFKVKTRAYLEIGNKLVKGVALDKEEMDFWESIYDKYFPIK